MEKICATLPSDKKQYVSDIGEILIKDYGKKKFYKPEEVKKAHQKSRWYNVLNFDFSCWGMSVFSSHKDFDRYHHESGEICDYTEMKQVMLNEISSGSETNFLDFSSIDLDLSWIDLSSVFEGLGDFFSSIDI